MILHSSFLPDCKTALYVWNQRSSPQERPTCHVAPLCCIRLLGAPGAVSTSLLTELLAELSRLLREVGACAKIIFSHDPEREQAASADLRAPFPPSWSCDKERCHVPFLQQVKFVCASWIIGRVHKDSKSSGVYGVDLHLSLLQTNVLYTRVSAEGSGSYRRGVCLLSSRLSSRMQSERLLRGIVFFVGEGAAFLLVWILSCVMPQWQFCPGAVCEHWQSTIH